MDRREKLTVPKFFGRTEVRNIGVIYSDEEDKERKAGHRHISHQMVNMMNPEWDVCRSASAAGLDVL
jgi:hypothetical protein